MVTAFPSLTWDDAIREFVLHLTATRAKKTVRYYEVQLLQLAKWATENDVPFTGFGKRHLDRYIVFRQQEGKSRMTLRHDGVCAKFFFAWCVKNDLIDRSPLAEYEVHNAPRPVKHMPTDDEMVRLLQAVREYWEPATNPGVKFMPAPVRLFHRDRNTAIVMGLLDSAARIGEMLSLKVDDYRGKERQIVIRESKGKEPRTLPVSPEWAEAMDVWVRLRGRIMLQVPKAEDEGWLFISDTGGRLDEISLLHTLQRVTKWAGISDEITFHSLRRFSLNKLAKNNLLMAQSIAGHKETKTTLLYTRLDPDFVREQHRDTGVLRGIVGSKRASIKRKKLI
jgi:site-specific recombinase XerD